MTIKQLTEVHSTLSALKMCLAINRPNGTTQLVNRINDCHELIETELKADPTAIDQIAQEREKQIRKGYTVEHDQLFYPECQLAAIASDLCFPYEIEQAPEPPVPINWNPEYWKKLINLPYEDRLRIAGAMLAGELDRVIHEENNES